MTANEQRDRLHQIERLGQRCARFERFTYWSLAASALVYMALVGLVVSKYVASFQDLMVMLHSNDSDRLVKSCLYFLCAIALWALLAQGRRKISVLLAHYVPQTPEWHQTLLELARDDRLTPRQLATWVREEANLLPRGS